MLGTITYLRGSTIFGAVTFLESDSDLVIVPEVFFGSDQKKRCSLVVVLHLGIPLLLHVHCKIQFQVGLSSISLYNVHHQVILGGSVYVFLEVPFVIFLLLACRAAVVFAQQPAELQHKC